MMSVLEYAEDMNKTVEEIIKKGQEIGINISSPDDMLDEDAIVELDNIFSAENFDDTDSSEYIDDEEEEEIVIDNTVKIEKIKKKSKVLNEKSKNNELAERKKDMYKNKEKLISNTHVDNENIIIYKENMTVADLANSLGVSAAELVKKLFTLGTMVTVNNSISFETAELLTVDYNKELKREEVVDVTNFEEFVINDLPEDLVPRPPVVTIMGHVDHGKTTLLDTIRKSSVAELEAGGITQAISAYQVTHEGKKITFIDTPGHAAFTEMRARGASITDIVIIIVAADDGIMPQTKEAIDHAKAAGVPIIVAINKIDKPESNIERIKTELSEYGLMPDEWGGDTLYSEISALKGIGIDGLLENITLISEMQEYKANPNRYALGTVVESRLDKNVGPVVTVLIQNGTLRLGDPIVVGTAYGKVRTLKNDLNQEITEALPSMPVEITGLNDTPVAGDKFMAFETEKEARSIGEKRKENAKIKRIKPVESINLEELFSKIQEGVKEINVIVKADTNGSAEAIKSSLEKIDVDGVRVKIISTGVGAINESDTMLAKASKAIIIGFNVRPDSNIRKTAESSGIEIRTYDIIYKLIEDIESAMTGMLDPVFEEKILGSAEVRKLFKFSKVGTIAGSYVIDGVIKSNSSVRIIRDGVVIYDGKISSIQREKDSVREIKKGFECGITIEDYNDLKVGDIIEAFEMVQIKN